jgi:FtsP/CotA-like multicopper oxidase with cupredoxin domain
MRRIRRHESLTIEEDNMVPFNPTRSIRTGRLVAGAALGLMLTHAALAQRAIDPPTEATLAANAAAAGGILDCLPIGQPLPKVPEIAVQKTSGVAGAGRVLRGTILLANEKQRIVFRQPTGLGNSSGKPGLYFVCAQQTVRVFRSLSTQPPMPLVPQTRIGDPMPGPTLRARLGDIVQLTFVNNINPGQFPYSIDQGEKKTGAGCDTSTGNSSDPTSGYPAAAKDAFPDCFHGSSTGNIHFHGTHTNPNGTGDNVFLEVRPSPIVNGQPTVTDKTVAKQFNDFFKACYDKLKTAPVEWPTTWNDAPLGPWNNPASPTQPNPNTWTGQQALLLQAYDQGSAPPQQLWPQNLDLINKGLWPQFYIGAYPYCYQIPEKDPTQPVTSGPLKMGQSPGTHWYHAHKHGSTAINVANGMTGVFIIEGATYDDKLNDWYGDGWMQRQPVLVINQLGITPNLERGAAGRTDKGPDFSVNGRIQPVIDMKPGEVQLWRIANTSGRSGAFFLGPPPGFSWKRIAQDGVQFADANYQASLNKSFTMAPGNRVDLLVKAPLRPAANYPVIVQHVVDPSDQQSVYPVPLVTVRIKAGDQPVTGKPSQFITTAPKPPAFLDDITDAEVQGPTRPIDFASTPPFPGQHTINGKKFDGFENAQTVFLNTVEEWKITNATANPNISHPFHIHINPFQVTQVFDPNVTVPNPTKGGPALPKYIFYLAPQLAPGQCYVDPAEINPRDQKIWTYTNPNDKATWQPCPMPPATPTPRVWWDVFPIPSGLGATDQNGNPINGANKQQLILAGYFKMRSRFVDYPGYYVLHCHILAHEDRGMMTTVEVTLLKDKTAAPAPFTHH